MAAAGADYLLYKPLPRLGEFHKILDEIIRRRKGHDG